MKIIRVLAIEDNALNMKLMRVLLQLKNFVLLEAQDAESGIELAKKEKPDLILMDIQLPDVDGLHATQIIRKDPLLKGLPIVALNSYAMPGDEEKAKRAGCTAYLTKPIDTRNFLNVIEDLVVPDGHLNRKKYSSNPQQGL